MTSIVRPIPGTFSGSIDFEGERRQQMAMNTEQARLLVLELWPEMTGEVGALPVLPLVTVLAIARGESGYGTGWKNPELLGNWASAQCRKTGSDCSPEAQFGEACALASDTTDGTEATRTPQCFRVYSGHRDGCRDFIRHLVIMRKPVRPTLNSGDAFTVAHVMRLEKYYNKKLPERHYGLMIFTNAREICRRLKLPEMVYLRPCRDCGAGSGEPCAKPRTEIVKGKRVQVRCPGTWYDGPPTTGPSPVPWSPASPGLPTLASREYQGTGLAEAPSSFDGGGGGLLIGAAVAYLLGGLPF